MSIAVGQRIPEATLTIMSDAGPSPVSSTELLGSGRVVLFAVPGAFTPTCSADHLPSFLRQAETLAERGVERLVCTAVNDIFVLDAWARANNAQDRITMAADGNGDFARLLGLDFDGSAFGMGQRSQRYAMILESGVIRELLVEEPGEFRVSSGDYVIERL